MNANFQPINNHNHAQSINSCRNSTTSTTNTTSSVELTKPKILILNNTKKKFQNLSTAISSSLSSSSSSSTSTNSTTIIIDHQPESQFHSSPSTNNTHSGQLANSIAFTPSTISSSTSASINGTKSTRTDSSSSTSSSSGVAASINNNSHYSELLRYRSQEFYTKLIYSTKSELNLDAESDSQSNQPDPDQSSSQSYGKFYFNGSQASTIANGTATTSTVSASTTTKELSSLIDLTNPNLYLKGGSSSGFLVPSNATHYLSHNYLNSTVQNQLAPTNGTNGHSNFGTLSSSSGAQRHYHHYNNGQQTLGPSYHHHPHYLNHLPATANLNSNNSSSLLLRSNSSLSLNHHYNRKFGLFPPNHLYHSNQLQKNLQHFQQLQPQQQPQQQQHYSIITKSTNNLFSSNNNNNQSATLALSGGGGGSQYCLNSAGLLASNSNCDSVSRNARRDNKANKEDAKYDNDSQAHYQMNSNSYVTPSGGGGATSTTSGVSKTLSPTNSNVTQTISSTGRPLYVGPMGTTVVVDQQRSNLQQHHRPPLTRSSSSGAGVDITGVGNALSLAPNSGLVHSQHPSPQHPHHVYGHHHHHHLQQQQQQQQNNASFYGTTSTGTATSSRSSSSLVSGESQYGNHHPQQQHQLPYAAQQKGTVLNGTGGAIHHYQQHTSTPPHGLPQRFPTSTTTTTVTSGTTIGLSNPSQVKLAHAQTIATNGTNNKYYPNHHQSNLSIVSCSSSTNGAGSVNATSATTSTTTTTTSSSTSNSNSFSRSFFANSNIFESKKNKLFGSVSSIDLQCLKESQKVSVIERKSSRIGRSLKSTSGSTASSFFKLFQPSSGSSSSSSTAGASGSSSTANPPTKNSGKMFPFSSNLSHNNNNNNNNSEQTTMDAHQYGQNVTMMQGSGSFTNGFGKSSVVGGVGTNDNKRTSSNDTSRIVQVKSNSLDSAISNTSNNNNGTGSNGLSFDPLLSIEAPSVITPANEILFRKVFTFYDLMSATNFGRLFVDGSTATSASNLEQLYSTNSSSRSSSTNGGGPVTTFESSTLSSTSSYSSCTSSMSASSTTVATNNNNHHHNHQGKPLQTSNSQSSSGPISGSGSGWPDSENDLLSSSPNFLNEIGSERQYSIELRWNNGFKEEIPSTMLNQQQHQSDNSVNLPPQVPIETSPTGTSQNSRTDRRASNLSNNLPPPLHPPSYAKRINIFSEASPFAALTQHSVMSDLYGAGGAISGGGGTTSSSRCSSTVNGGHSLDRSKKSTIYTPPSADSVIDFDLDDGFGSLSSASFGSSYPLGPNGPNGSGYLLQSRCPFSVAAETCNVLEMDYGTNYYRTHFLSSEHQNWLQIHDKYGPIVISLRKERVKTSSALNTQIVNQYSGSMLESSSSTNSISTVAASYLSSSSSSSSTTTTTSTRWRIIVRTTSLIPLRGTVAPLPSICLPEFSTTSSSKSQKSSSSSSNSSNANHLDSFNVNSVRDILGSVMPKNVNIANFRLGSPTAVSLLLKLDELSQNTEYKIGVLYAYGSQHSEEEFYNNILDYGQSSETPFYKFLNLIASRVRLREFKGYKAGLDVLNDTTGEHSWTSKFGHVDIMFHVCTELPFTETNRQQLPRKRHIGNDIVTIVFLDENFTGPAFTPALIRSKFQQVFIIIKPVNQGQYYRVAVARHRLVPLFGPPLKPYYSHHELRDFILTKIINAENACHSVNKFAEMAKRTRNEYLTELCAKHITTQTVQHIDSGLTSNSLNSFKKLFGSSNNNSSSNNGTFMNGSCDHHHHHHHDKPSKSSKSSTSKDCSKEFEPYFGCNPCFGSRHILNGIKDPPTLLGGVLFGDRCAGTAVPCRLMVHDFLTNRDLPVSLLLSNEAILVIDSLSGEVIWAAPVTSIIGWTDSSGVFATSPTREPAPINGNLITSSANKPQIVSSNSGSGGGGLGLFGGRLGLRAKSMDSDDSNRQSRTTTTSSISQISASCRELRLYYHQGECIQIIQRPMLNYPTTSLTNDTIQTSTSSSKSKNQSASVAHNDDPFLHLVRILELITRKSELREIVIKRKSGSGSQSVHASPAAKSDFSRLSESNCGANYGFSLNMSTGLIEEIVDPTLATYQLSPGSKVCEIAKISFAAMSPGELQELLNQSVIICLTFTEFDFLRHQPRCNCPWPQAIQLQRLKNQHSTGSEYENLPKPKIPIKKSNSNSAVITVNHHQSPSHNSPLSQLGQLSLGSQQNLGVKTIHITHASTLPQSDLYLQSQQQQQQQLYGQHTVCAVPTIMNSSVSSSGSSYYSANQSPSSAIVAPASSSSPSSTQQFYSAKSSSNLNSSNSNYYQCSPVKQALSATSSPAATVTRTPTRTQHHNNQHGSSTNTSTLKDNLIRLITMDDSPTAGIHGTSGDDTLVNHDTTIKPIDDDNDVQSDQEVLDDQDTMEGVNHQGNYHLHQSQQQLSQQHQQQPSFYHQAQSSPYHGTISRQYSHYARQQPQGNLGGGDSSVASNNHQDPMSMSYSSYPSSRYSTASSAHYSSMGRNGTVNHHPQHFQHQSQQQLMSRSAVAGSTNCYSNAAANGGKEVVVVVPPSGVTETDCFLLTAQPVRVDQNTSNSSSTASSATSGGIHNNNSKLHSGLMQTSLDSSSTGGAGVFNSLLSGSSMHSSVTSETIGDIVWPSMHSPIDSPTPTTNALLRYGGTGPALNGQQDLVVLSTGTTNNATNGPVDSGVSPPSTTGGGPPMAKHLTDEVRKLSHEKDVLHDTIIKLREENQRLHLESQTASQQLRKLTEWFFNTGTTNTTGTSSNTTTTSTNSSSGSASSSSTATNNSQNSLVHQQHHHHHAHHPQSMTVTSSTNGPANNSPVNTSTTTKISIQQQHLKSAKY